MVAQLRKFRHAGDRKVRPRERRQGRTSSLSNTRHGARRSRACRRGFCKPKNPARFHAAAPTKTKAKRTGLRPKRKALEWHGCGGGLCCCELDFSWLVSCACRWPPSTVDTAGLLSHVTCLANTTSLARRCNAPRSRHLLSAHLRWAAKRGPPAPAPAPARAVPQVGPPAEPLPQPAGAACPPRACSPLLRP